MINNESIEELKAKVHIVEVIGDFVKLKKEGADYVGKCPFHQEKTPSFKVSASKEIFKCFGCGKSGDAIQFVIEHQGISYFETIKYLAAKYNFTLDIETSKRTYVKPQPRLEKIQPDWITYFETKRHISNNTLLRFGITQAVEWMPKAKADISVLCFNYFKNEELVNIKFRGVNKDFKMAKDAEQVFYNLDAILNESTAVICEGEIDCMSLYEAGVFNAVSVPNGANANGIQQLQYLDNCFDYFDKKEKVIICTDNDKAGYNLREELARRIGKDRCLKVNYPDGCKDANEVLIKHGRHFLYEMIQNAVEWPIEGIMTMDEMYEDVTQFYLNGYPEGVKIGIPNIDDHIQLMPGQFTTVTGIPGSGKSEFVDYIVTQTAKNHNWKWAVCSFENQPSSIHVTKLMEKISGKSFSFRKNPYDRMTEVEFKESVYLVDSNFSFININTADVTLTGILDKAKELVRRKGIKGLLIDPWNYIEHKMPPGQSETQYISECLTQIKSFCLAHGVHVFLIAHPTKMQKDKQTGKYEIPTMYNISGSAHFFNKTDNGITIYRNYDTGIVDVYIQKIRYAWLGKIGFCSFNYDTMRRQYNPI